MRSLSFGNFTIINYFLQDETCYPLFDANTLDAEADIIYSGLSMIESSETFSLSQMNSS
jgi:hypothetical protein